MGGKRQVQFLESYEKKFNSLSQIEEKKVHFWVWFLKRVQFFESYSKRFNSLNHIIKRVQFFKSYSHIQKTKDSIIGVTFKKKRFNSLTHLKKKVEFCESCQEGCILWLILFFKKGSILGVVFLKKERSNFFKSYSKKKKGSIP